MRIWWVDAWETAGWTAHKRKKAKVYPTVGILVDEDDFFFYTAHTVKEKKEFSGYGAIPKGMVLKYDILESPAKTWFKMP